MGKIVIATPHPLEFPPAGPQLQRPLSRKSSPEKAHRVSVLPLAPTLLRGGWGSEPPVWRRLMTHWARARGQPSGCEPGRGVLTRAREPVPPDGPVLDAMGKKQVVSEP